MGTILIILLTLSICGILFGLWLLYNNEITFRLITQADNAVYKYQTAQLDSYLLIENIAEKTKAFENYDANEAYNMLYSYHYVLWRPWITSAIKPEYRELLKPYIE